MNVAVIFAGGSGTRMTNADIPKQFLLVHGKPIIVHTIEHFQKAEDIDAIIVVCIAGWIDYMEDMKRRYDLHKIKDIVAGGETGQMSIYNGLAAAEKHFGNDKDCIVLIHDGVRPLIKQETITDNINSVKKYGSAITVSPAGETVVLIDDPAGAEGASTETANDVSKDTGGASNKTGYLSEAGERILSVPDRSRSRFAKAPQSFYLKDILEAERKAISEGKTNMIDSCSLMTSYGYSLHTVMGPDYNIKVTTPKDFIIFRAIYDAIENKQLD
ncbi:2-C-methyl-D-erythritol 4-phosphate cytidylyltransferase [Eubacterium ruminantium]|nr:2-C-methyl-D-erythritol 4-phosphate cytidylyltransferase [Eubacterium ruminantium]